MNQDTYSTHSSSAAKLIEPNGESRQRPVWRRPEVTILRIEDMVGCAGCGTSETFGMSAS